MLNSKRKYIRHPVDIPIDYSIDDHSEKSNISTKNICHGGMCFQSLESLDKGTVLKISIPVLSSDFSISGKVIWCLQNRDSFEIGIKFLSESDAFVARLVEQISHIKHYQNKILKTEGRKLSDNQAAKEWIEHHADDF